MSEQSIELNQSYWDSKYQNQETGWDLGQVSPPIKTYFEQIENKDSKILIPGCGNAYEADFLLKAGFTNITLIDISPTLTNALFQQYSNNPNINIINKDFFELQDSFDLIIEQTFFCALNPNLRQQYVKKMHVLLNPNGRIVGLLFASKFHKPGPPFGGELKEYQELFEPYFNIKTMATCYNSFEKRMGNELFINLIKQ